MSYPALQAYLDRLATGAASSSSLRLSEEGEVQGHIFNCWLGSAFHPIRALGGDIAAYAGRVQGVAKEDQGLPLWSFLDGAASDDESVALDRLCRTLHAINFFHRAESRDGATLHLNVHDRLLSAVSSNHGMAYRRILDSLGLPIERVVLQLPAVNARQNWMLNYVADNYRRNGFRISVKVASAAQLPSVLGHARVDCVRIGSLHGATATELTRVLAQAAALNVEVIAKDDTPALRESASRTGARVLIQDSARNASAERLAA